MASPRIGYPDNPDRIPIDTIETPSTQLLTPLTPNPADVAPPSSPAGLARIGDANALRQYAAPPAAAAQNELGAPLGRVNELGDALPAEEAAPAAVSPLVQQRDLTARRIQMEEERDANPYGSANNHPGFLGKVGHVLAKIGNVAGDIVAPSTMALIPGTELNRFVGERKDLASLAGLSKDVDEEQAAEDLSARSAAETAGQEETTREAPGKAASEENLQGAQTYRALHPLATSDFELLRQEHPDWTAEQIQAQEGKPLSADDAAARNAVWDKIADQYHLPKGQFRPGMSAADASALATSLNNVIGRNQGAQGLVIKEEGLGNTGNARADRSYQYNQGELDKLTAPVSQLVMRMGRLNDTLAQGSPQADALVAPELLTVMAGGQGSGLRMNEAEIARIVGGRSQWESLKASAQKWSTNPETANSITADQRKQIRALVTAVNAKMQAKQTALDDAGAQLIDSDDPKQHRAIVQKARQALTGIDEGQTAGKEPPRPPNVPPNYKYDANGPKGAGYYAPAPK